MNLRSLMPVGRDRNVARSDNPFMSLQREIDRLFDDFTRGFPAFSGGGAGEMLPSMDVTETDKQIEITAELPGLEEKDVQVNFADNVLTIRGEKKAEKEEKDKNYPAGRAQLWFVRAFARIAGRSRCQCHQGQHRQRRAQGDGAEAGAGAGQEDRRQGRRLSSRGVTERCVPAAIAARGRPAFADFFVRRSSRLPPKAASKAP